MQTLHKVMLYFLRMKKILPTTFIILAAAIVFLALHNFQKPQQQKYTSGGEVKDASSTISMKDFATTSLIAWGRDDDGQVGQLKNNLPASIISVAAGKNHSLALGADGAVWSWGDNESGQLGRSPGKKSDPVPAKIPNLDHVISISARYNQSFALKDDGTIWGWGSNFTGALGTGDNKDYSSPTQVVGMTDAVAVSAGYKFTLALKKDGSVWGWGASCSQANKDIAVRLLNSVGSSIKNLQGGYYDSNSPGEGTYDHGEDCLNENVVGIKSNIARKLDGLDGAAAVSAGYGHALILKKDGSVWSFGCNLYGQIGVGNFINDKNDSVPKKVTGLPQIIAVSAGFRHSMALATDGNVYAWGIDAKIDEQHNTFNQASPLKVPLPEKAVAIVDGHDYYVALGKSGTAYAWGEDDFGILGSKNKSFVEPVREIKKALGASSVALGNAHLLVLSKTK
jgi:alpha-tubulin suppressor-like RCC1 family protein